MVQNGGIAEKWYIAIDLDSVFVWFDDNLFEAERIVLERNYVLDGYFKMDPRDLAMAKKALGFLTKYNEND